MLVRESGGCANAVRESVLKTESERERNLSHWGTKPRSILHLTFWSDTLPTELSRPSVQWALPLLFFFYPSDLSKNPDLSRINFSSENHSTGNQPLSPTTRQNYPNNSRLQKTTDNNHAVGHSIQSVCEWMRVKQALPVAHLSAVQAVGDGSQERLDAVRICWQACLQSPGNKRKVTISNSGTCSHLEMLKQNQNQYTRELISTQIR